MAEICKSEFTVVVSNAFSSVFGENSKAINFFDETLLRNPDFAKAYYEKAKVLFKNQAPQEALENLKIALKYSPEFRNDIERDFKGLKSLDLYKQFFDKK